MKINIYATFAHSLRAVFCVGAVALASCQNGTENTQQAAPAFKVETVAAEDRELTATYPASIQGEQDIEIRPNVSGFITRLCVDEGSTVTKGQLLFVIDPVPYEAAVNVAKANVKVAKANVETARLTAKNKTNLHQQGIISDYEMEVALNALESQRAVLAQADAQLVNANNNLSYTRVKSPSNGTVGTIPYRVGSLVSATSAQPLTTVSATSEMFVYFSLTEKELLELLRREGNNKGIVSSMPSVQLQLADGSLYPYAGAIETISGVIDPTTGAVRMRATFPNEQRLLRSGGAGNVLIPHTQTGCITIAQKNTYEIQDKKFVYVLQADSTMKSVAIQIYPLNDGAEYIVTSGLEVGQQILAEGVQTMREGTKITPVSASASAATATPSVQAPAAEEPQTDTITE